MVINPKNSDTDIAIFLPSLRGGGAERVCLLLANGFVQRGYKVDLVLVSAVGPYLKDIESGVRVIDLKSRRVFFAIPSLIRYFREQKPAAVLSALDHANAIAVFSKFLSRVSFSLVVSIHNTISVATKNNISFRSKILSALIPLVYKNADAVVAVSDGVATDIKERFDCSKYLIHSIHNPVVTPAILKMAEKKVEHPWLQPCGKPLIIGVGRLTKQKNFHLLIRAFDRVRAQYPCRLVILGEGELRKDLEALAEELGVADDILLPGFQENPFAWMRTASLFVLSSDWEGLPTVLIEAMASGTPVVSTECPSGPSEILENGKWGRLVPCGDIKALADGILEALMDKNPPDVAKRAQDFVVDRAVDKYLKVLLPQKQIHTL